MRAESTDSWKLIAALPALGVLLACAGVGSAAPPPIQWGVRYYHDRDLQPGNGWDVDYAVWFEEDGRFRMKDEGMCLGRWTATGDTISVTLESFSNPDGEPGDVSLCSGPTVYTVKSAELLVGEDTREFRVLP